MENYRLGVGIIMLNKQKKVFAGKRIDTKTDGWQMPQGGIDTGESLHDALWRELFEETGCTRDLADIIYETKDWYSYKLPSYLKKSLWGGKYEGQKQKWFLLNFKGQDSDINILPNSELNKEGPIQAEFSEWNWLDYKILPTFIVDFKRQVYIDLINEVGPIIDLLEI